MPVNSPHPEYDENIQEWRMCRDVLDGEKAVKAAGAAYLPMLSGQDDAEYQAYVMRANFYNASSRTVKGLAGAIFRKNPVIEYPKQEQLEFFTPSGDSFKILAKEVVEEVIGLGRVGVFVDTTKDRGNRAFASIYYAENIINWREVILDDGTKKLTLVVLREIVYEQDPDGEDEYDLVAVEQFRELSIDKDGNYRQRIFVLEERKKLNQVSKWVVVQVGDDIYPKMAGGKLLKEIPFVFISPLAASAAIEKSPILDLIAVNLSHYRTSADHEHGMHFTALPTAYITGIQDDDTTEARVGSAVAWKFHSEQATVGYLEFSGAGLEALDKSLTKKEQLMAVLGARLLEQQKQDAEAARTVALRHAGENSVLASIAESATAGLLKVLGWVANWSNSSSGITLKLNTDFLISPIDASILTNLLSAVQAGNMSHEAFFYNLERAQLFPEGWTLEQEKAAIEAGPPMAPPGTVDNAQAGTQPENDNSRFTQKAAV